MSNKEFFEVLNKVMHTDNKEDILNELAFLYYSYADLVSDVYKPMYHNKASIISEVLEKHGYYDKLLNL